MSTKRELYKLINESYRKCEDMQHVPEIKNKQQLMELINQQNELKDKFKFFKHLNRYIKEDKNEN